VAAQGLEDLLARTAQGDRAAFRRLYEASAAKLYGVALRILRRGDWAEEVLQDCYLSIWSRAGDYRAGLSAPMTWMTSIVRNRCLDWLRRPAAEVSSDTLDEVAGDNPGPLADLERAKDAQALARCLGALDARQRHAELASHLRQPLGTVKTWVRRGLLRLKSCLELQSQS
jgi:RNA polymerase sigma-70 factor (ECF subfamily)